MILSDITILDRMTNRFVGYADDELMYASTINPNPYRIEIDPFNLDDLQGASVDLRLGQTIIYRGKTIVIDDDKDLEPQYRSLILPPGRTCLAHTSARIHVPHDCVARVEGKSSIGRQFVVVHCTAGWCDPGFDGYITLELANHDNLHSFLLEPNMPICQLTFLQLDRPAERQYKGKYQGAKGVEAHKR